MTEIRHAREDESVDENDEVCKESEKDWSDFLDESEVDWVTCDVCDKWFLCVGGGGEGLPTRYKDNFVHVIESL